MRWLTWLILGAVVVPLGGCKRQGNPGGGQDQGIPDAAAADGLGRTDDLTGATDAARTDGAAPDGGCGVCTGGQSCVNGACACPEYQAFCNGQCIPVSVDPNNCGGCGVTCSSTQACSGGQCSSTCLPGLSICNRQCVDLNTDSGNCGACGSACPANQGCVNGTCKPAVVVGPPPAKCTNGGPPIIVTNPGTPDVCAGNLAQITFTWALCSCQDVASSSAFQTDAYDSTKGPYAPGGLGGGVGANGLLKLSSSTDVGGTLWSSSATGVNSSAPLTIRQDLQVGGPLTTQACTVGDDAYVAGNMRGNPITIGKTLYQSPGATRTGVTAANIVATPVSVPAPCSCNSADIIPVAAIVAARQTNNDNALIGLDPAVFTQANPPQRLDLPCGNYYLNGIQSSIPITIVAHGRTALYIGGDLNASSPIDITLDPAAELDVFVGGTVKASARLSIGSPNYPALCRTYVGGTVALTLSSNVSLATNLYDATALVAWSAPVEVYGAVFAGDFQASQNVKIHYDRQVVQAGQTCPGPGQPAPDGGVGGGTDGGGDGGQTSCTSCRDCRNQACVNGQCGACTSNAQCCSPLVCNVNLGRCELPIY